MQTIKSKWKKLLLAEKKKNTGEPVISIAIEPKAKLTKIKWPALDKLAEEILPSREVLIEILVKP